MAFWLGRFGLSTSIDVSPKFLSEGTFPPKKRPQRRKEKEKQPENGMVVGICWIP